MTVQSVNGAETTIIEGQGPNTALQRMLVQEANGKIFLLPAWPKEWDVDFKLHLERHTIITGTVKDGKLLRWDITPATRKEDVVIYKPQGHSGK